jgi:AcrR family transcriptional regulator
VYLNRTNKSIWMHVFVQRNSMTRSYTLKRRAEKQAETRQRIVEAAVELHGSVGPALTTISMVAERAGVQRHTLYAHFPDERSLLMACSGLVLERDPLPDPDSWRAIDDRWERLRTGLEAIYAWFGRNADLNGCVLRDAEVHSLTREIVDLRMGSRLRAFREVLGSGLNKAQLALLDLALSFFTWRTLARASGADVKATARLMVQAIDSAGASIRRSAKGTRAEPSKS